MADRKRKEDWNDAGVGRRDPSESNFDFGQEGEEIKANPYDPVTPQPKEGQDVPDQRKAKTRGGWVSNNPFGAIQQSMLGGVQPGNDSPEMSLDDPNQTTQAPPSKPQASNKWSILKAIRGLGQSGPSQPGGSAGGENTLPSSELSSAGAGNVAQEAPRQFNGNGVQPTGPADDQMFQGFLETLRGADSVRNQAMQRYGWDQMFSGFRTHPNFRGYRGPQVDRFPTDVMLHQADQMVPQYEQLTNMVQRNRLLGAQIPNIQATTAATQAKTPTIQPLAKAHIGALGAQANLANTRADIAPQELELQKLTEQNLQDYRRAQQAIERRGQLISERGQDIHLITAIGSADSETAKAAMGQAAKFQKGYTAVVTAMKSLQGLRDVIAARAKAGGDEPGDFGTGLPGTGPLMGRVAGLPMVGPYAASAIEGVSATDLASYRKQLKMSGLDYENAKGGVRLAASPAMWEKVKSITPSDETMSAADQVAAIDNQLRVLAESKADIEASNPLGKAVFHGEPIPSLKNIVGNVPSVTGRPNVSIPSTRTAGGLTIQSGPAAGGQDRKAALKAEKARRDALRDGKQQP